MIEKKISQYLIYAIGEIALIMLGILLALQVSNWNQHSQQKTKEVEMLKSLKAGLQKDIADIESNIRTHQDIIYASDIIYEHLTNDKPYDDSLSTYFRSFFFTNSFLYATSSYKTLQAQGVDLISNEGLREQIIDMYDRHYVSLLNLEKILKDILFDTKAISQSRFTIPIESSESHLPFANGAIPVDFENLKIDTQYQYNLNLYREMNSLFVGFCNNTIKRINGLIAAIDEELA